METIKQLIQRKFREITKIFTHSKEDLGFHKLRNFYSEYLARQVKVNIYLPPNYHSAQTYRYPVVIFNDGQDMEQIRMAETLHALYGRGLLQPIIVAAIHAGDRMHEYGIIHTPDYKGRGSKAGAYAQFIVEELVPFLHTNYRCLTSSRYTAFAGFSLGGLSAMDIVWHFPHIFSKVGVFSGSFWWRYKPFTEKDPDGGRIMHEAILFGGKREGLRFWFQTGTHDEASDRNNNGVIDAIDDTLDIMRALKSVGYSDADMHYLEIVGGEHNPRTWSVAMPDFLVWAFGKQ
jgi:enterochelin esterase-like enzyme